MTRAGENARDLPASSAEMYRAMVGLGLLCGLAIVSVFLVTRPRIEQKRALALERAIRSVLPGTQRTQGFVETASGELVPELDRVPEARVIYAGYGADGTLVGVAVEAMGLGYQDVISVLYGYSLEREAIVGLEVLASLETPGLGDRIETDPAFRSNFLDLGVRLDANGAVVAHPIVAVPHGQKRERWQVDGITGATVSSVAIADLLRESTARWIPVVRRQADRLREPNQNPLPDPVQDPHDDSAQGSAEDAIREGVPSDARR